MANETYDKGMAIRREVLGDDYVDQAQARKSPFTEDFQDLITRYAWGEIWARPGLDRKTRSCITLAMLISENRGDEFKLHVQAALNNGLTADEIKEVILQSAIYAGVPAANTAFKLAKEVIEQS